MTANKTRRNYPYVDLEKAVVLAEKIHNFAKQAEVGYEPAIEYIGYTPTSGTAKKIYAALKSFGLVEASSSKKMYVSNNARLIILGDGDPVAQKNALQEACLSPNMYKECWEKWGADMPDPKAMRHELIFETGFNEATVDTFISHYMNSLRYAKLIGVENSVSDDLCEKQSVGIDEKTIDNSTELPQNTPIPVQQQSVQEFNRSSTMQVSTTIESGAVTLQFPATMSESDYADLKDWLRYVENKIKRMTNVKTEYQEEDVA